MKPTGSVAYTAVDPSLVSLLGDRWTLWLVMTLPRSGSARFSDLAEQPGLSRRVLADRLRLLERRGLVLRVRYRDRPVRYGYALSERGASVHRGAWMMVSAVGTVASRSHALPEPDGEHPVDTLLRGDPQHARQIFLETIAPLERYDEQYRTELVATLEAYLDCDASVAATAARLFAHRHTIRYRLGRIAELTGLSVDAVDARQRLHLGVRAMRILRVQ